MKITNFEMVGDFMEAFGQEVLYMPIMPSSTLMALRLDLINEEVQELRDGMGKRSMLEMADALTDILYVVYGAGHAFGIDLDECFDEVHRSNMTKLGEDGRPLYRKDGKVMKGPNYEEPDLSQFLLQENEMKLAMFADYKEVNDSQEFEMAENGFVLRVSGHDHNDNWLTKAFIFDSESDFFEAVSALKEIQNEQHGREI